MPVHDWTRVDASIFYSFQHSWITELARALNQRLPSEYYPLIEQITGRFGPDGRLFQKIIAVRQVRGDGLAGMIAIVSPGSEADHESYRCSLRKAAARLERSVHLVLVDIHSVVGKVLADMPMFLEPGLAVTVPLEATYNAAFAEVPRRWRRVLEAPRD